MFRECTDPQRHDATIVRSIAISVCSHKAGIYAEQESNTVYHSTAIPATVIILETTVLVR